MSQLPAKVENFIVGSRDIDVRGEINTSAAARRDMVAQGIYDAVRGHLLDVILRNAMSPQEWGDPVNVAVDTPGEVRDDASEFWAWLFDGEAVPS